MLPLVPSYAADGSVGDDVLALVRFDSTTGVAADGSLGLAVPGLGDGRVEVWHSPTPVVRGHRHGIAFARNEEVLFGALTIDQGALEAITCDAYEAIVRLVREAGYPYLLRAWNHVRDVNQGEGDRERYKHFSAGRHEALTAAGLQKSEFPAASAVGMSSGELAVYFVAARNRGAQVENPRQVAAYDYPRQYGRRSPSFSRATAARWNGEALLFISGTASVVGHATTHAGDADAQLQETLVNLERIAAAAAERIGGQATLADLATVKVYLRRGATAYDHVAAHLATALPNAQKLYLESDICRGDLLLEIEAIGRISV
jgi:chorismate lyase/3-hydroxybenzoate synthase